MTELYHFDLTLTISATRLWMIQVIIQANLLILNDQFFSVIGLGGRSIDIMLNQPEYGIKQFNDFGFLTIKIVEKNLNAKYHDIEYNCDKEQLDENDLEEGDFIIFDMSSCKNNKIDESIEIVDHYIISKER